MIDYFSIALYLITFSLGFLIKTSNSRLSKLYFLWLYVFLCFGYMTGSDWRAYEIEYDGNLTSWMYITEPFSLFLLSNTHYLIPDFFLFLGLSKCLYLWSSFRVIRKVTINENATVAILLHLLLIFMLISNPLRFMWAMILINLALESISISVCSDAKVKWGYICILIFLATLLHNSAIVFFLFFPLIYFFRNITKIDRKWICISFFIVVIITSNMSYINEIKNSITNSMGVLLGFKDYSESYSVENNESLFAVGNILKVLFFSLVLLSRDRVVREKNGFFIYSMTIVYFFLDRFLILIPTGFRLVLFLTYFYSAYISTLFKQKIIISYVFIIYFAISLSNKLWSSFDLIPYSNSIPYILSSHNNYDERCDYNFQAYQKRFHREYKDEK